MTEHHSPAMIALVQRVKEREEVGPAQAEKATPPAYQRELERLTGTWEAYRSAQRPGTVVVVHGPQAQSTLSLVKVWRRELVRRGEQVFEVTCGEGGGQTYQALRTLVSQYYGHLDDLGLLSEEAQGLFNELSVCLGLSGLQRPRTIVNVGAAQPGQIYFYELLGRFFTEASRLRPAVLVVRDLHQADASSLASLIYIAENFALDPIDEFIPEGVHREGFRGMLALTVADGGEVGAEVLSTLQRGMGSRPHASFVDLRGVDEETVRQFLQQPEVISRILAITTGIPANLDALVGLLPDSAEALFGLRLASLSQTQRHLLDTLSIYGRPMSPDVLVQLTEGVEREQGSDALMAMTEAGILARKVGRGEMTVSFCQESAAAQVREGMLAEHRSHLHGKLAQVLIERQRFGHPVDVEEIAHHLLNSGDKGRAVEYALAAAEKLHATFAYQRARQLLEAVLPLLDEPGRLEEVFERLIDISASLNDHRKALFYCGQLKRLRSGAGLASVYRLIGRILLQMGKYDLSVRALAKALYKAGQSDDRLELVRVLSHTAEALYGQGQYDRAVEVCLKGLEQARGEDSSPVSRRLAIDMTNTLGKVCLSREDYDQASEHFKTNSRRAEQGGWPEEKARALFNLGTIAVQRRDFAKAEEIFLKCLSFGHSTANTVVRAFVLLNLAVIYQQTLRFEEALDCYLHALATFKKSGNDLQFAVTALNLADVYEVLGDLPKARVLIEASLELTEAREIRYFFARGCSVRGRIALGEREPEIALDYFKKAHQGLSASPTLQNRQCLHIATAHHDLGQRAERDRWLGRLALSADTAEARELSGDAALFRAQILADEGDFEAAEPHARASHGIFEDEAQSEKLWLAFFQLGRICRGLGRIEEAKQHVDQGVDLIKKLSRFVPTALQDRYMGEVNRRQLHRLQRALERGDPFEDREVAEVRASQSRIAAVVVDEGPEVIHIGEVKGRAFNRWRERYEAIIGEDARLHHLFRMVDKVANSDSTLLLTGESGTGKELFAEAIHSQSGRRDGPLIKVNCASFVETLLLSELFGHEKGSFTGALSRKKGRFEMANGGTIFLDEIGDISANTQVSLLRVLQEHCFERVGGNGPISVDVRVVAATNRHLEEMVRQGTFRLDLYYRLKGVILELPPLRERRGDIPLLVRHFTEHFAQGGARPRYFSHDALRLLSSYNWPGNIRELENFVRSMMLFVDDAVIDEPHIREFDEFFATGQMSAEAPRLSFARGWWSPEGIEADPQGSSAVGGTEHAQAEEEDLGDSTLTVEVEVEDVAAARIEGAQQGAPALAGDPEAMLVEEVIARGMSLQDLKKRLEMECIKRALIETDGNITHAATILKMKRPRLSQIINASDELGHLKDDLA